LVAGDDWGVGALTNPRKRIRIDELGFTGPERKPTFLSFHDGVNIIWGASNSGKSFVRKSIDYVLGGDKPTLPPEGMGYDNYVLWLTLPGSRRVSLRCSALGGDVYKADGHVFKFGPSSSGFESLSRRHVTGANVSRFLLSEVGFRESQILKNERAEKSPFSLRLLMRYLLVDETRMIDEKSILLAHNTTVTSEDKGLIKFLLTGVDGSSIEQVRSSDELKAARDGKIELLSQMANELGRTLDDTLDAEQVRSSLALAEEESKNFLSTLSDRQEMLDMLSATIRELDGEIQKLGSRMSELRILIVRFEELGSIYASDIERLQGLEEGGFLLQRFAGVNCPLCGAAPGNQTHDHGLAHVEEQRRAVAAEIAKIGAEALGLDAAIGSARDELAATQALLKKATDTRSGVVDERDGARKLELGARQIFVAANERVKKLEADLEVRRNLEQLEARIDRLRGESVRSRTRADGVDVNLDLTQDEAHRLSKTIQKVLAAWNYPGGEALHFAKDDYDIVVDGKRRRDNGAGVRALLHAAFKVGVLVYCLEHRRPHPGFVILDSPLLAYRPAEEGSRYGALQEDEIALRRADVARHFYQHLQSLSDNAQFIVIENHKSDQDVVAPYPNYQFTRNPSIGRTGLFV
jgi:hypothetical protein